MWGRSVKYLSWGNKTCFGIPGFCFALLYVCVFLSRSPKKGLTSTGLFTIFKVDAMFLVNKKRNVLFHISMEYIFLCCHLWQLFAIVKEHSRELLRCVDEPFFSLLQDSASKILAGKNQRSQIHKLPPPYPHLKVTVKEKWWQMFSFLGVSDSAEI